MRLNGFAGPEHQFVRADAMEFLSHRVPRNAYDLAVVDPPTFSNSKQLERVLGHPARPRRTAAAGCCEWMTPGGVIFFSTNFRRFKLAEAELPGVTFREISRQTVPPDFRNRRIHRCWVADAVVSYLTPTPACSRAGTPAQIGAVLPYDGLNLRIDLEAPEPVQILQRPKDLAVEFLFEINLALGTVVETHPNHVVADVTGFFDVQKHAFTPKAARES